MYHHSTYGHTTESCTLQKVSYANVARKTGQQDEVSGTRSAVNSAVAASSDHTVGGNVDKVGAETKKVTMLTEQMKKALKLKAWVYAA